MKWWPWAKRQAEAPPDQDAVTAALIERGDAETTSGLAVLESCAGIWARAFASAEVMPATLATRGLTPRVLAEMGRDLCVRGEALHLIEVRDGQVRLRRCSYWDVHGARDWMYRADISMPDGVRTVVVPEAEVIHTRYASHPSTPWRGVSPLANSPATAALAAKIENQLRLEFNAPTGTILFSSQEITDNEQARLKRQLVGSQVAHLMVGSGDRNADDAGLLEPGRVELASTSPASERLGPRPEAVVAELRMSLAHSVMMACGVPPSMANAANAGAQREAWRQVLHSTLAPLGRLVAEECAAKLSVPTLAFNWERLWASDLQGRARAFAALVKAEMASDRAEAIAGFAP